MNTWLKAVSARNAFFLQEKVNEWIQKTGVKVKDINVHSTDYGYTTFITYHADQPVDEEEFSAY